MFDVYRDREVKVTHQTVERVRQALVMLARKLARVVFALLKGQSEYQPKVS
ncbi:hypothetical protein [Pseudomonas fluorescens]|uniref:hypothetical protein n=1 Tax=Pseudomonas fluorescens TaxID=294 RepID=UPI003F7B3245